MNMNIGDAHGGRGRRGSLPPPAAAAIAVSSIAVSSIVAIPSTDHVPAVAVVRRCCVCPFITVIAAVVDARMWPRPRCRNDGPPPDDKAVDVIVGVALAEAAAAALSFLHPLHPIASFTC